jgi:predicted transcriptional regulator
MWRCARRFTLIERHIAPAQFRSMLVDVNEPNITSLTTDIVSAYVTNNTLVYEQVPDLIKSVYAALNKVAVHGAEPVREELKPAVSIKKSVTDDYIICLEDGKKFKSLKRHLRTHYDMSPEEYREKWGLSRDYPMVAPAYAAARSQLAKTIGLGQRREAEAAAPAASSKSPKGSAKGARATAKGSAKGTRTTAKGSRK